MSWTADEGTLAFDWIAADSPGVRLLNVGAAGGSLLADSHPQIFSPLSPAQRSGEPSPYAPACQQDLIITPDGSAVVCGAIQGIEHISNGTDLGREAVTGFREYSTATGKIVRISGYWKFPRVSALAVNVLWSNAPGSLLIGVIPTTGDGRVGVIRSAGRVWVGVISGNEFTPLNVRWDPAAPDYGTW